MKFCSNNEKHVEFDIKTKYKHTHMYVRLVRKTRLTIGNLARRRNYRLKCAGATRPSYATEETILISIRWKILALRYWTKIAIETGHQNDTTKWVATKSQTKTHKHINLALAIVRLHLLVRISIKFFARTYMAFKLIIYLCRCWCWTGAPSRCAPPLLFFLFRIVIYLCWYTKVDVIKMKMKVFSQIEFEFLEYHFVKDCWLIKWFEDS